MRRDETPEDKWKWLEQRPPLDELQAGDPAAWAAVERDLATLARQGLGQMQAVLEECGRKEAHLAAALGRKALKGKAREEALAQMVKIRMLQLALRQHCVAVASGVKEGKVRFNLINGLLAQRLLFREGLERRPVSLFWFRLLWPLLWQRRRLMPLVQPKGIYCFYTRELVEELARLIDGRNCLEIGAGDGTLSRFLSERGVRITATDDQSWAHAVRYPDWVLKQEAREALARHAPEVVLCSWPPPGNSFERQVFRTRSVQLYIVISSRHRHAAGNWGNYEAQSAFSFAEEPALSRLVLPPELDSGVYLFRRLEK